MTIFKRSINELWAYLIIEELTRQGITYFCLAPGSRSTPLTVAIAKNPKAIPRIHYDERGLAFHALGYAKGSKKPAVIVVTSGTAVVNLFPAIVEASQDNVPLIILSADRPPELRSTGANQSIDQIKIFGDYVRYQFDLPCPNEQTAQKFVLSTTAYIAFKAGSSSGPVQLNCMFKEPFFEDKVCPFDAYTNSWLQSSNPYTEYHESFLTKESARKYASLLNPSKNGIIILGPIDNDSDLTAIIKVAKKLQWPIFPDIQSGMRTGYPQSPFIPYHDLLLKSKNLEDVDIVLQLGERFVSKSLLQYLENKPTITLLVSKYPFKYDPLHQVNHRFIFDPILFCQKILDHLPQNPSNNRLSSLKMNSQKIHEKLNMHFSEDQSLTEPGLVRWIMQHIPNNYGLFIASSMPIRDANFFSCQNSRKINLYTNRGASGIDGNLATAFGIAQGSKQPMVILIGDLACLHDLNSLSLIHENERPCIIVVVNNQGGGIFSFLPISKQSNIFEKHFATPHEYSFRDASMQFNIDYSLIQTYQDLTTIFTELHLNKKSALLEIQTLRSENYQLHQNIFKTIEKYVQ